jgi:hypothetical protein
VGCEQLNRAAGKVNALLRQAITPRLAKRNFYTIFHIRIPLCGFPARV